MRALRLTSVCAVALLVVSCAAGGFDTRAVSNLDAPVGSAESLYATGKSHFAAERWGAAVHAFQTATARDPHHVGAYNGLAAAYDRLGRFDLADRAYMEALTLAPDDPTTLNNMGWSRHLRGQPELARVYLRHAAELAPEENITLANLDAVETVAAGQAEQSEQVAMEPRADTHLPRLTRQDFATVDLVTARDDRGAVSMAMPPAPVPAPVPVSLPVVMQAAVAGPEETLLPVTAVLPAEPPAGAVTRAMPVAAELFDHRTVEIANGNGIRRMAARTAAWLGDRGVPVSRLTNADTISIRASAVFWRTADDADAARALASLLPGSVSVVHAPSQGVNVRLVLGADLGVFDAEVLKQGKNHDHDHVQVAMHSAPAE